MRSAIKLGLAIGGFAALAACSQARGQGSPVVSRSIDVGPFSRISLAGPYDVEVRTGDAVAIAVRGSERQLDDLLVDVRDDTLRIRRKQRFGIRMPSWNDETAVRLSVTVPALSAATIAGSGDIRIDRVAGDSFDGTIAGSGELSLGSVAVKMLSVDINGSGSFSAAGGQSGQVRYSIAGSGDIGAGRVASQVAQMSIAGSGNIDAHATRTASVDIAGSGDVRLRGGAKCSVRKHGSGSVDCA